MSLVEVVAAKRGVTEIAPRVMEKLALRAAVELDGVELAPGPRLALRRTTSAASARIDGQHVDLALDVALRYPMPIAAAADQIRAHVRERISSLAGLEVDRIAITVAFLRTPADEPSPARVA